MAKNPFGVVGRASGNDMKSVGKGRTRRAKVQAVSTVAAKPTATAIRARRQAQNRALAGQDTVASRRELSKRKKAGY